MTDFTKDELIEVFDYLDMLRNSGTVNIFGASAYVEADLAWDNKEARQATVLWMETFSKELTFNERVEKALEKQDAS